MNLNDLLHDLLSSMIYVPDDYHDRVNAIKKMMSNDISGLVTSLIQFYIDTASSVNFYAYSGNDNLDYILNTWLEDINVDFNGLIPSGVNALAEEYFKERWANSSFVILKLLSWKEYKDKDGNSLLLPAQMAFVDGSLVFVDPEYIKENQIVSLDNLPVYYLGNPDEVENAEKLDKAVFLSKPFDRWFDIYPVPFLIRRGTYYNYRMLEIIKEKQGDILVKIISYFLLLKRGTEEMLRMVGGMSTLQQQLEQIKQDLQQLVNDMKTKGDRVPLRFTMFDEEIQHVIPDFEKFLKSSLTSAVEKAIISSLGWIDVPDSAMSSRRESIINPKPAMEEIKKGIRDFRQLLVDIVKYALKENKDDHFKFASKKVEIYNSEVTSFITQDMRDHLRSLYDRGVISKQTYAELVGNVVYVIEKIRREREINEGDEILMYPPVIRNMESDESLLETMRNEEHYVDVEEVEKEEKLPEKKQGVEKDNFRSSLEGSPYKTVRDLPDRVRKNIKDLKLKRVWLKTFNNAYDYYSKKYDKEKAETLAFRVAWRMVKKMGKKTKKGWVLKEKYKKEG